MADSFQLKAILSAVDKISPHLTTVRRGLNMTHKSFRDLGNASRGIIGGMGLAGILSFSGLAYGAINAAQASMQYASSIQDAADVTGVQVEQLQALQGAFRMGGVDVEKTNDALVKFNKSIADGAAGTDKGFASMMQKLRIPLRNANGELRTATDVLPEFAAALEANKNVGVRTRMAMEAFGKTGAKLVPTLAAGSAAVREMLDAQRALGKVLSEDSLGKLDKMDEALEELGVQYRTQVSEMFAFASPAIMPALKALEGWIAANQTMLQQKIGGYIANVAKSFEGWVASGGIEKLGAGIIRVVEGIGNFIDAMGGMQNVLIGVGAIMLIGPVASAAQLLLVLGRLATYALPLLLGALKMFGTTILWVGRLLLANPVLAIIAAIAAGAYLIYTNWSSIGPWMATLWENIKGVFVSGMALLMGIFLNFSPLGLIISNWEPIVGWFSDMWNRVSKFIEPILNGARAVGGLLGSVFSSPQGGASGISQAPSQRSGSPISAAGGLAGRQSTNVNGEMKVRFENAPPGMRVDPGRTNQPGLSMNPDVGYRSALVS